MNLRACCVPAVALVLALACSSDDDPRPPSSAGAGNGQAGSSKGGVGGSAAVGGSDAQSGGAVPVEGGASNEAGEPGIGQIGGASIDAAGAPSAPPPECAREQSFGEPDSLSGISTGDGDERLLAMTHDELTLVFTRDDALMVADRSDRASDFELSVPVTLPVGYTHAEGVALHPDGLGLVVVSELGDTFADVKRAARSGSFDGALETERFAQLASHIHFTSGRLSSPVLSSSGSSLFFTLIKAGSSRVFRADGADGFSSPGTQQDSVTLGGSEDAFKLTQSLSADARTLFFFDESLAHSAGLWSVGPGKPFTQLTAFPGMLGVFTGSGCRRLYGTRTVGSSLDVVQLSAD